MNLLMLGTTWKARRRAAGALALACLPLLGGCIQRNPATRRLELVVIPWSSEAFYGRSIVKRRLAETPIADDLGARSWVNRVGDEIARVAEWDEARRHFYVVQDESANAYTVPGGHVFVTTALLEFIGDDDDLLAAVIAHETGHVRARHVIKKLESIVAASGLIGAVNVGTRRRQGPVSSPELPVGSRFLDEQYELAQELEADMLAAEYLHRAGYPDDSLVRLLEAFAEADLAPLEAPTRRSGWAHSHPSLQKRLLRARRTLASHTPSVEGGRAP